MKKGSAFNAHAARLLSGVALGAIALGNSYAVAQDVIVVTSQRTEQSIQDVPLAVSAFSNQDLEDKQIESFTDFQLNTPNFSFSRTQFTGSSIVIRGIGALAVAADSEPALSVHMNDLPLASTRLFETEFYDLDRVEILRGPQGTLFGRNATGGVINVITAKADPDALTASAEAQYGNYDHVQVKGHLNIPLGETAALRVAGLKMNRSGTSVNLFDGQDVDDRDVGSVRGSLRWYPSDNTTVDIVTTYFTESDNRLRSTKTLCTRDPIGVQGCLPGSLGFDTPNIASTLNVLASSETYVFATGSPAAAAFGLFSVADQLDLTGPANPADFRTINVPFTPQNDADELVIMGNIQHDFESFSVKVTGGWGRSSINQQQQQNNLSGPDVSIPLATQLTFPIATGFAFSDGRIPISAFETSGFAGSIGGNTQGRTNTLAGVDFSTGETEYYSAEGIVTTNFDGRVNFLVGGSYNHSEGFANFHVAGPALDYTSIAGAALITMTDGAAFYGPNFYNDGNVERDSLSAFGEVYIDFTDTFKFTAGVRYNNDEKNVRDRGLQPFGSLVCVLSNPTCPINPLVPGSLPPFAVPLGTTDVSMFLDSDPFTQGTAGAVADFRVDSNTYEAVTGRAVFEWNPTDETLLYASYSRGYKPGGFNPLTAIGGGVARTYESEFINAIEVGMKYTGNGVIANVSGFYYDYSGLQISRIVNRAAINDNVDATIWGIEGEFVWNATDRLTLNTTAAYLNTDIGAFSAFDPGNPTAGQADTDLFKDLTTAANCVVENNGAPTLIGQTFAGLGTVTPFSVCSALETVASTVNALTAGTPIATNYVVSPGIEQNLEGNKLPGSPEWQFNVGAQYVADLGANHTLTTRADYYRQGEFFSRPFNAVNDRIDGYDFLNIQVTLAPNDGPWYVRGFVQNALNGENITGSYLQDQSSGSNYNVFLQEPRRYGVAIGARF
ncbi:MAG: TonB-dependent receptor [Hyphococcus sp.]|nr:MAG: TonB-dependent receptor [Marinicaulis sp.]